MAGQLLSTVQIIVGLLTGVAIFLGFYKVITDRAKMEADLRNEIKNLQDEIKEMKQDYNNIMTEFKFVTQQLQTVLDYGRRVTGLENFYDKVDRKMDLFNNSLNNMKDTFNEKLGAINVSLERKQDKPR